MKLDHDDGYVPGSTTPPEQLGAILSVRLIFFKSSVPVFVTLIRNTALFPVWTV